MKMDIYKCPKIEKPRVVPENIHEDHFVTIMLSFPFFTRFFCDDNFLYIF